MSCGEASAATSNGREHAFSYAAKVTEEVHPQLSDTLGQSVLGHVAYFK